MSDLDLPLAVRMMQDGYLMEIQNLKAENAKLRELVGELLDNLMPEICDKAWWCQDKNWRSCNDDACGNYTFVILANELGIEVNDG